MPKGDSTDKDDSLGNMEGLKSYIPNEGWSDLSSFEPRTDNSENNQEKNKKNKSEKDISDPHLGSWDEIENVEKDYGSEKNDDFLEDDLKEDVEKPSMGQLARKVAKTNSLVDKALGSLSENSSLPDSSKKLDELGDSLSNLFKQLYDSPTGHSESPWSDISDSLSELSNKIDTRESLREKLKQTQSEIDQARLDLIKRVENVANQEQERLSVIRMRSRLATVMADKLLNKLR